MTISSLEAAPTASAPAAAPERQLLPPLEWAAFGAVLLVWALYVLPARGGWEADVVPRATALLLPSLLLLRPWRHCSAPLLLLAGAPALGTAVVAAAAPFGDGGPISLSRWGYFGGVLLATAAFARTERRRAAVVAALALFALHQYTQAWLPWWGGGGSIDGPMLGTIYSANPFGSLMLGFALLAWSLALLSEAPLRRLGFVVAPFCAVAVVLSGARAAMLLLACGVAVLAVIAMRRHVLKGALHSVLLVAASAVLLALSTSSYFFSGDGGALSATTAKTESGQTLDSTTSVRFAYWDAAWGGFLDHPVVGGGSGSYLGDSRTRMPPAAERSPFAHSEVLGSLAEGGLVLGLPVLAVFLVGFGRGGALLLRALASPLVPDPVRVSAAVAAGSLLLHGLLDFALSFPAILALLAMLLGIALGSTPQPSPPQRQQRLVAGVTAVAIAVGGVYLGASHDRLGVSSLVSGSLARSAEGVPLPGARDARGMVASARALVVEGGTPENRLRDAERDLRVLAPLDGNVEALRLDLLDRLEEPRAAVLAAARDLALRNERTTPLLLLPYAERLAEAGDGREASDLLLVAVYRRADEVGRVQGQLVELLSASRELAGVQQPGTTCATQALQAADLLADDKSVKALIDRTVTDGDCAAWAAQAAQVLGETS